jgi:hypothetical protein
MILFYFFIYENSLLQDIVSTGLLLNYFSFLIEHVYTFIYLNHQVNKKIEKTKTKKQKTNSNKNHDFDIYNIISGSI